MKKDSVNKIKLGAFVSIAVVLFAVGVYFVGIKQQLFKKTFHMRAVFKDVSGLQVGNNIRFSGITVGTVEDIAIISDTAVQVDMIIDAKAQPFIKKDSRALIGSDGLMGNKILTINPGTPNGQPIEDNDFVLSTQPISMDEIMNKLKMTVDNAALITGDLSSITGNIRKGRGTIGKLFMDTIFANNLNQTIVNVKKGSRGFSDNMEAAQHSFLLKGFFKKKEKKERKEREEREAKEAEEKEEKTKAKVENPDGSKEVIKQKHKVKN